MINNQYKIKKELGKGSFSIVYKGKDTRNNRSVAIKIIQRSHICLYNTELKVLTSVSGESNFPTLLWSGISENKCILVISLLGNSLSKICIKNAFSLSEVSEIGTQMVKALEVLHSASYLHRDMKTENILKTNKKGGHQYYLIDFGLSYLYEDKITKHHYPQRINHGFKGNLIFCSLNILSGIQASRRDDLISLHLILIYLIKGTLPWIKFGSTVNDMIGTRSCSSYEDLVKNVPVELVESYNYVQSLGFYQKPDYKWISSRLDCFKLARGFELTEVMTVKKKKKIEKTTCLLLKS